MKHLSRGLSSPEGRSRSVSDLGESTVGGGFNLDWMISACWASALVLRKINTGGGPGVLLLAAAVAGPATAGAGAPEELTGVLAGAV